MIDPPSPTSPPTSSRCSRARAWRGEPRARRGVDVAAGATRRPTAPGSAAGAPTTSTAPAPSSRRSSPPAWPRATPRSGAPSRWLVGHQNPDGGWGEDLRSYDDPGWAGRGASTASQTAWALLALLAAGRARADGGASRGVALPGRAPSAPTARWDEPIHRHRLPRRLLHQLPPVPAGVPADGARPLRDGREGHPAAMDLCWSPDAHRGGSLAGRHRRRRASRGVGPGAPAWRRRMPLTGADPGGVAGSAGR